MKRRHVRFRVRVMSFSYTRKPAMLELFGAGPRRHRTLMRRESKTTTMVNTNGQQFFIGGWPFLTLGISSTVRP